MYERSYGYLYETLGEHPSAAAVAKAIRAEIKQAQAEGMLPRHWTYSVRSDTFAGGCSVDVTVRDCADAWQECTGSVPGELGRACPDVWCSGRQDPAYAHAARAHQVLTAEARAAEVTLERIHRAYNHTGSEIQTDYFDVRYYGIVTFEDTRSAEFRRAEAERKAARRKSIDGGRVLGKVIVYGRQSRHVHVLTETTDGKHRLACGAPIWRSTLYRAVDADVALTCSRCAKRHA